MCAANGVLHLLPPNSSKSDILDFLEGKIYGDDAVDDASTALTLKDETAGRSRMKGGGAGISRMKEGGGGREVFDLLSSSEDESDGGN